MQGRTTRPCLGALLGSLALAAPATAASHTVTARDAVARPCHRELASSHAGRDLVRAKAPARGLVSVRLRSGGDWDLGVFGARGRLVAGSASFGGNELASGFVRRGERLTVQACRYRGDAASARVAIGFTRIPRQRVERISVLDVVAPRQADRRRLQALGVDLTEHADADSVEEL